MTNPSGGVDARKISVIVEDLVVLKKLGFIPILVSSGAINTGKLSIKKTSNDFFMTYQQAASAVGQPKLLQAYDEELKKHGITLAQILVTHEDFKQRQRFLNIRNTLNCLIENDIIPIINENDTISFDEITVGDNDQLATMISTAVGAEMLILLTEADGLFDKNPSDPTAKQFKVVEYDQDLSQVEFGQKTTIGRGGMDTKLKAVKKLTPQGIEVRIGTFDARFPITRLIQTQNGTRFRGNPLKIHSSHKAWLSVLTKNESYVVVDEGAANAISKKPSSLLPVGIKKVIGKFKRGDIIQIRFKNKTIAVGLVEYSAKELELIRGLKSDEFASMIPDAPSKVAIHRDNLLMTGGV